MTGKFQTAAVVGVLGAAAALGWQGSLASLQLTQETFERSVKNYVFNHCDRTDGVLNTTGMGAAAWKVFSAMSDGARASTVKELGTAAKGFVMSPAFAAAYDEYVKSARNAVNHGIQVRDANQEMEKAMKSQNPDAMEASMNKMMRDNYRKQVMERLPSINQFTKETLAIMAEVDQGMMDSSMPATAAEKANVTKGKAMINEAKKLAATDLEKAKATYKSAMMLVAGLSNESQAAAGVADEKKAEQQRNYNRLALKPMLKRQLQAFVAIAKTVDFKAATADKGGKKVFVNAAYERRSEFWKMLYRLGPGGTNAAVGVAQGWIAEL